MAQENIDSIMKLGGGSRISDFLFGSRGKAKQLDLLNPLQKQLLSLIQEGLTSGEGPFGELFGNFNQANFEQGVVKPALKNFQENILPQIQEKFIAGNQALGSGMRRGQLKAATDLQDKLAQLMYQAQQQQQQNKFAGLQTALGTKAFENIYKPGTEGALMGLIKGANEGFGKAAGAAIAG